MINCDFCFCNPTGCVCLVLLGADRLHAIPKLWFSWQSWHSRALTEQGAAGSHLALWALPGDNPRAQSSSGDFSRCSQSCDWAPGGTGVAVAPPGPGDQEQPGRDQSIPMELLRCCKPTINQFMGDARMAELGKKSLGMEPLNSHSFRAFFKFLHEM